MVLNSHLVIKIEINRIWKNFVKSMSVKKFSYLGEFILGLRRSGKDYASRDPEPLLKRALHYISTTSQQRLPRACYPVDDQWVAAVYQDRWFILIVNSAPIYYLQARPSFYDAVALTGAGSPASAAATHPGKTTFLFHT